MYLPPIFAESRLDVLHRLIRSHPFGTLVILSGGELDANHLPFLLVPDAGPYGTLHAHVSRANPVWTHLDDPVEALAIFQGPDSYVTPSWYPAPAEFAERMIARIVGIEIPIASIRGKWKVSQNRKLADRLGVAAGLKSQATEKSRAMAELVTERAATAPRTIPSPP